MRRSSKSAWILLVLTVVTTGGLPARSQEKSTRKSQSTPTTRSPSVSKPAQSGQLDDKDCRAFATKVVEAVKSGNTSALNDLIDWESLFNKTLKDIELTPKLRQDINSGLKSGLSRESGLSGQIVKNSQAGGSFDFLRIREDKNQKVILCRLIQPAGSGGVAYFEFVPEKSADGKIRATDVYVFSSGELLSSMLRRGILPVIANENRSFLDKLVSGERDYVSDLPKFSDAAQKISDGKMKEALALIQGMKTGTKKQKAVFLLRLRAAQAVDENEYAATLDEYRKLFPRDPGLDLLSIAYYTTKKDFKQALECINRVESAVGGDPYLNVTRGTLRRTRRSRRSEAARPDRDRERAHAVTGVL